MAGYGTDGDLATWAAENGYTLSETLTPAVLRQRGSAYLDGTYEARLSGIRTGGLAQERAFPRTGAEAYGETIPSDAIPVQWEHASYFAAYQESVSPGSLSVIASTGAAIKREKIDVIETEYVTGSGDALKDATPLLSAIEGLVRPFLTVPLPAIFVV